MRNLNLFKKIYLWSFDAKLYMGLYFVALTFYIGAINYFILGIEVIDIMTLIEALIVCIVIAFSKAIFFNDYFDKSNKIVVLKYFIWIVISIIITLGVAIYGEWFNISVAYIGLCAYIFVALSLVLIGFLFDAESSTVKMNKSLENYKRKDI